MQDKEVACGLAMGLGVMFITDAALSIPKTILSPISLSLRHNFFKYRDTVKLIAYSFDPGAIKVPRVSDFYKGDKEYSAETMAIFFRDALHKAIQRVGHDVSEEAFRNAVKSAAFEMQKNHYFYGREPFMEQVVEILREEKRFKQVIS